MSLVWHWTVKEWRAQRLLLCGYAAMILATLATVLTIVHLRGSLSSTGENGAGFVLMFMGVTAVGSVLAASATVGSEVVGRDDALWRRLPHGLRAGFAGKLVLQALLLPALMLVGALAGEIWLVAIGRAAVAPDAVLRELLTFGEPIGYSLLALPWVFAVSFWLHKARLALAAALLLITALGMATTGILKTSPGIEKGLQMPFWLWPWLCSSGLVVAAVSCLCGRRGGYHRRSALLGGFTTILVMLPPAGWLGWNVYRYWFPDLSRVSLDTIGATADGRFAMVHAVANYDWPSVLVRVDLHTGEHVQLPFRNGAVDGFDSPLADASDAVRAGLLTIRSGKSAWLLSIDDLQTHSLPTKERPAPSLPAALSDRWQQASRAASPLRQPDGRAAWFEQDTLCLENADGSIGRVPIHGAPVWPAGHGLIVNRGGGFVGFDFGMREWSKAWVNQHSRCVASRWFTRAVERQGNAVIPVWHEYQLAQPPRELPQLRNAECLGLAGNAGLWFVRNDVELLLYEPANDTVTTIALPTDRHPDRSFMIADRFATTTELPTDYRSRQLLRLHWDGKTSTRIVAIDHRTRTSEVVLDADLMTRVLHCEPDGGLVASEDYRQLVRYDARGKRSVIWPRPR